MVRDTSSMERGSGISLLNVQCHLIAAGWLIRVQNHKLIVFGVALCNSSFCRRSQRWNERVISWYSLLLENSWNFEIFFQDPGKLLET